MTVGSLFSGIGGLDLGLERAGMTVEWQCEIDSYCRSVLKHHWPDVPCYEDIHAIQGDAPYVDLIAGGFPCQPVSLAGKGLAQEDPRWLWPEFARVVGLLRPRYVLVENVPGLARRGLGIVLGDLSAMGFDAEWEVVSAASCGAPHIRERIFVFAYPNADSKRFAQRCERNGEEDSGRQPSRGNDACRFREDVADTTRDVCKEQASARAEWKRIGSGRAEGEAFWRWPEFVSADQWIAESQVGRVATGIPGNVARLRGLGNAVVPQVAEFVGRCIMESAA